MLRFIQSSLSLLLALSLLLLSGSGCHKQNIQQFVVETPQMATAEDAEKIEAAAESIDGVLSAKADLDRSALTVIYNSLKLAEKNVETAIAEAGYDANSILAAPKQSKQ